jgi:hypothetical protein
MRKYLVALALTVLVGCGGGGSSTPNPFAGQFIGTWTAPSIPDTGTANVTVASNGSVAGTSHDNGANADGSIVGTINANGNFNGTVTYPGFQPSPMSGTLAINGQNHLVGTVIVNSTATNFDLVKQ